MATETTKSASEKKSGIKKFKPGEVLFNENDPAESLYIIQRGQIRLYRPKGRGFIEIAILRAGEVIGEMAYFDEKASRRSCSAAALVSTEVIEISFKAFAKTMSGLNPWFKTIINTLADRLRKTNDQLKRLETNSLSYGKSGAAADYQFFQPSDMVKLFSSFFLCLKAHGQEVEGGFSVPYSIFKFYAHDIYGLTEVKLEEFKNMLHGEGFLELREDEDKLPNIMVVRDINAMRSIMIFLNSQRMTDESKRISLSLGCQMLMGAIVSKLTGQTSSEQFVTVDLTTIFKQLAAKEVKVDRPEYEELTSAGLAKEIMLSEDNFMTGKVDYQKIKRILPSVKIMNAMKKVNESKSK